MSIENYYQNVNRWRDRQIEVQTENVNEVKDLKPSLLVRNVRNIQGCHCQGHGRLNCHGGW